MNCVWERVGLETDLHLLVDKGIAVVLAFTRRESKRLQTTVQVNVYIPVSGNHLLPSPRGLLSFSNEKDSKRLRQ